MSDSVRDRGRARLGELFETTRLAIDSGFFGRNGEDLGVSIGDRNGGVAEMMCS